MNSKVLVAAVAAIVIVGLGVLLLKGQSSTSPATGGLSGVAKLPEGKVAEGNLASDFTLSTFDGQTVTLASQKGKAVLVDFWAAWCPFCIEELPEIEKISQEFKDDLVVLGIHRSETEDIKTAEKFAKERGVTYPLLKDADGSVYKTYTGGRNFMPTAAFIDKEGKIVKLLYGPKTEDQMRQYVKEALGQAN